LYPKDRFANKDPTKIPKKGEGRNQKWASRNLSYENRKTWTVLPACPQASSGYRSLFEKVRKNTIPMKLLALLQTKALVTLVAGVLLVGGAVAFAATPAGQTAVQSLIHAHPTVTAPTTHDAQGNAQGTAGKDHTSCPGQADAQNLAATYQLSTSSTGNAVTALCALHQGTFKGTTTAGVSVIASRVYGYGEIDQLLTLAQYLAAHDSANVGGKLSDSNVSSYLANALHSCGSTPLEQCLLTNIPGFQPGSNHSNKPTATPHGNKPTTTPTPHGNKPTATPTPHD